MAKTGDTVERKRASDGLPYKIKVWTGAVMGIATVLAILAQSGVYMLDTRYDHRYVKQSESNSTIGEGVLAIGDNRYVLRAELDDILIKVDSTTQLRLIEQTVDELTLQLELGRADQSMKPAVQAVIRSRILKLERDRERILLRLKPES